MANMVVHFYPASSFFKVSGDNKVLKNEEYAIASMKGESIIPYNKDADGRFRLHASHDNIDIVQNAEKLIPDFIYNKMISVATVDEIMNTFSDSFYNLYVVPRTNKIQIYYPIPILIKQTKAEPGYQKNDILVVGTVDAMFNYSGDNVTGIDVKINIALFKNGYIYGEEIPEYKPLDDLKTLNNLPTLSHQEGACFNTNAGMIITNDNGCVGSENFLNISTSYHLVPYFVAEKGTVKYEINNTVNGLAKYNASKDKKLEYKINVKNIGNAPSSENVITTYVPEEVTVNESSISDSGVYNSSNHSITWTFDYFDVGETKELDYQATAPATAKGKELIGHSTIESGQVAGVTQSSNTIVTMDKIVEIIDNPETGTMVYIANTNIGLPLSYIMMFLVALFVVILFLVRKLKKTQ